MDSDDSEPDAGLYQSSDDEDYVPDGASGDDDDDDYTIQKGKSKGKGKTKGKNKQKQIKKVVQRPTRRSSRRRSGGICLREPDSDEESEELLDNSESEEDEEELEDATENDENQEDQKKRIDDIWTSMKNDKNVKNNSKVTEEQQQGLEDDANDSEEEGSRKAVGNIHEPKDEDGGKDKEPSISEKESNDSKEVGNAVANENNGADAKPETQSTGLGKKRSGGLSGVVGSLSKKQKLSTLEKSKHDWDSFKKEKGLEDELRNNSKDGYLSKQEFLQRVDYRTWENERELRLATGRSKK